MIARPNILVSSAGRRGELVQILRDASRATPSPRRVYTADMSTLSSAGLLGEGHHLVPRASDPGFIPAIMQLCADRDIGHIIPTIDPELPVYAEARAELAQAGTHVWCSGPETVAIARDKRLTHQFLSANDLPHVTQLDLASAISAADLAFPLIAKPARGSASVGLQRVESRSALESLDSSLDYVVETIAPGVEHTVDVLVDSAGSCRAAVTRRRLEVRAGEVSKGVALRHAASEQTARSVVEALPDAFGVLNVQMFHSEEHARPLVIEINARFGGGYPLAHRSGLNAPRWLLDHLEGQASDEDLLRWDAGTVMLRFDQGVYADATTLGLDLA